MTPKEKAEALFNKFYKDPIGELSYVGKEKAKEFATIVVDEILEIIRSFASINKVDHDYWNEVKKEIDIV